MQPDESPLKGLKAELTPEQSALVEQLQRSSCARLIADGCGSQARRASEFRRHMMLVLPSLLQDISQHLLDQPPEDVGRCCTAQKWPGFGAVRRSW